MSKIPEMAGFFTFAMASKIEKMAGTRIAAATRALAVPFEPALT